VWLIGAMVCLRAAPWVQLSVSTGNGWPHNALQYQWLMPISCQFRDCKALLVTSLTHVSGAITSVQMFTLCHSLCILSYYTVSQKNAPTFASSSFDKHRLILIIFGKQHQHTLKMICVFIILCPFTFTYFICF